MRLSSKKGFTLTEALFASGIMAIGLFTVVIAIYFQTTTLNKNREQTIATLTAQGEIEFLRGQPFVNITTRSFYKEEAPGLEYLHYGSGDGKGDIVVGPADFTSDSHIKKVSVTVTWNSINGKELTKTMATFVTENGINKQ
jgi:type II secretory pathway pseudopilin PulG